MQIAPEVIEIKALAEAYNIKMSAVLAKVGVPYSTYWRWLNDGADPKTSTLRRVRATLEEMKAES